MLRHQLAQEGDAVHARHLDVERDDVGHLLANLAGRHEGVAGGRDHLYLRIFRQHGGQGLPDACGVVDDENPDFFCHGCCQMRWNTVLATCFTGRSKPVIDSECPMNR